MKRTTLIAAVFAALIVASGFAAAAPGNAPVDVDTGAATPDDGTNTGPQQTSDAGDRHGNSAAADKRSGQGPAVDLPEQVPDHVSAIHERISSYLSGDLEGTLGDAISEVTPDDEQPESETDEQAVSNATVDQAESSDDAKTEA